MNQEMRIFDAQSRRLYLTPSERDAFRGATENFPPDVRTFAYVMLDTGCRISEALALQSHCVDFQTGTIRFETLKKKRRGIFRDIPASGNLLSTLDLVHSIKNRKYQGPLWDWCRTTGYYRITEIMKAAHIEGPQATPKGLRHAFGVHCIMNSIPLNLIQKWMGHAELATTAIYLNAVGEEERNIAARLWT